MPKVITFHEAKAPSVYIYIYIYISYSYSKFLIVNEGDLSRLSLHEIESELPNCFSKNKLAMVISSKLFRKTRNISIVFLQKTWPCRVSRCYSISIYDQ